MNIILNEINAGFFRLEESQDLQHHFIVNILWIFQTHFKSSEVFDLEHVSISYDNFLVSIRTVLILEFWELRYIRVRANLAQLNALPNS